MSTAEARLPNATTMPTTTILLELDEKSWNQQIDRVERWLDNTIMMQSSFRRLAEDAHDKLHEPHLKSLLAEVARTAGRHEQQAADLYHFIGRSPSAFRRRSGGAAVATLRKAWADLVGTAGSAAEPFRDLQQLFIASLNSSSAFAVAEQLGLALGIRELAETAFAIVAEKHAHHLLLQEITLESAATAILYHTELAEPGHHTLKWAPDGREQNVGPNERYARLALGAAAGIAAVALARRGRWKQLPLAALAASGLGTGISRYCPINSALGVNNAR